MKYSLYATLVSGLAASSLSAEPITIKVADVIPLTAPISQSVQNWMKRVDELYDGEIEFEHYPASQLGKAGDMLTLAQTGVADVTYVAPAYISESFPLSDVPSLPGNFDTTCQGTQAVQSLFAAGGILDKAEFEPNGVRMLIAATLPTYEIFSASRELTSLEDISGMKIRSSGPAADLTIRAIGGVPVRASAPEIMEALQRGTVDANHGVYYAQTAYDWAALEKYASVGASLGSFVLTYSISLDTWNDLPAELQQIMTQAGEESSQLLCELLEKDEVAAMEEMEANGVQLFRLTPEMQEELKAKLQPVTAEWVKQLSGRGLPAQEAFDAFTSTLKQ